jgi:hypothetical protein
MPVDLRRARTANDCVMDDDHHRLKRIERAAWLSEHNKLPPAIPGRVETLYLLEEARQVFVDGYFAAALLLCLSVINHCLVEELQLRGAIKRDPGFEPMLKTSKDLGILQNDWYDTLSLLFARRHPFVHFKNPEHEHSLGARVVSEGVPPKQLMEEDAKSAMICMHQVFMATLHEWNGEVRDLPGAILLQISSK